MTGLVGISYKSADLEIRECFSFTKEDISKMAISLSNSGKLQGLVVLSTCNRSEIYYHCPRNESREALELIMAELTLRKNYTPSLAPYFYFKENSEMVEHLFQVVSGIDSLIVGEDQVIGQVKDAFYYAEEIKSTDKILRRLFTKAFEVGKKVRTQTQISRGSASASSAAVNLCHHIFPDMSQLNLLMIGAGQTGQLVLKSLRKSTFGSLIIANRTFSKAEELAILHNGKSVKLEDINQYLPKSDIVFIATDSAEPIVKFESAKRALQQRTRPQKQLYFDLSVPRNVEDTVGKIKEIDLYTIDDLQHIVESTNQKRMKEISAAMNIIRKANDNFASWKQEQELIPTILKIKHNFHKLNQDEIKEFMKIRSIKEHKILEEYSNHITEKFARVFIKNLKAISKETDKKDFLEMAKEFFEL